ncbi:GNAT family N-acetyltransferase [Streptomyces tropicalis]|uniref:GNAT family N-acetyltransferase n=1 Tax=Streptomyces tropicalis TaxID=3034234 RepID=A0ABT6ABC8_9ACTN|nr:GNAT family N-acetyltransferase [Streptomyces tropicalis]MDF3301939.1 GNAT family N-acetyltransferase [Streptomyces tropicalis]
MDVEVGAGGSAAGRAGLRGGAGGPGWPVDVPGERVLVREPEPADEGALLTLFEECEDWFEAATGLPSAPGDVQSLYYALPEGAGPQDKVLLVVERDGVVAGVVDAVCDHPVPGAVAVGLFLLAPWARGRGLGRAVAEALLARAEGVTRVTASVPPGWRPGERFLERLGFTLHAPSDLGPRSGNRRPGPRETAPRRAELLREGGTG